jgi:hypothetical protein
MPVGLETESPNTATQPAPGVREKGRKTVLIVQRLKTRGVLWDDKFCWQAISQVEIVKEVEGAVSELDALGTNNYSPMH